MYKLYKEGMKQPCRSDYRAPLPFVQVTGTQLRQATDSFACGIADNSVSSTWLENAGCFFWKMESLSPMCIVLKSMLLPSIWFLIDFFPDKSSFNNILLFCLFCFPKYWSEIKSYLQITRCLLGGSRDRYGTELQQLHEWQQAIGKITLAVAEWCEILKGSKSYKELIRRGGVTFLQCEGSVIANNSRLIYIIKM